MSSIERIAKIHSLVSLCQGSLGSKKKLHKLVYLLQEAKENFDYKFTYHYFGVFSPSLAEDLDTAAEQDFLVVVAPNALDWGHRISLGSVSPDSEAESTLSQAVVDIAKDLSGQKPKLLEVLSTIVYLDRNYIPFERIRPRLAELKPKLTDYYDSAFELARTHYRIGD